MVEGIPGRWRIFGAAAAYLLLLVLGALQGLIGSFEFAHELGPVPAAALGFCVLILATCVLAGIGMASPAGGLMPALGWFVATVALTLPTSGGSVIVTNTSAGKWYLYGGAVSAGVGTALTFRARSRRLAGRAADGRADLPGRASSGRPYLAGRPADGPPGVAPGGPEDGSGGGQAGPGHGVPG